MKAFFRGVSAKGQTDKVKASEEKLQQLLVKAEGLLKQLKTEEGEDFPLLNESTRVGGAREHYRCTFCRTPN